MLSFSEILEHLRKKSRPDQVEGMSRFGIRGEKRLGVSIPDLRKLAREIGKNHEQALRLWESGIEDARILASMVEVPEQVDGAQMEIWAGGFNSWDVCDQVCLNLFVKVHLYRSKIEEWAQREEEFVRRAAFAMMAIICVHDKQAPDENFTAFFPLIKLGALDNRNYVKKAVSWALRNIGKRNQYLNGRAQKIAREIQRMDSPSARWVAADVLRELQSARVQKKIGKTEEPDHETQRETG